MNIGQVRYFVAVYEAGSFSGAAKAQFITVQAVSKSIADLEQELGQPLFERKSRGVEPTAYGKALYGRAVTALASFDELQSFALGGAEQSAASTLHLTLCAPNFYGFERVVDNIRSLTQGIVGAPVSVDLCAGYEGLENLRSGKTDALITIGQLDTPFTDCVTIADSPTGVSLMADHPLASLECVTLDQLAPYPVVVSPDLDYFNESILVTYTKRGLASERIVPESLDEVAPIFSERQGYAFSVLQSALADKRFGTVVRPLCPSDMVTVPICFVTSKYQKSPLYKAAERALTGASLSFPLSL